MDRKANGTFAPGVSGNPGGRPKQLTEVVELSRAKTTEVIDTLHKIVQDTDQPTRDRVRAGDILLSRAWGLPTATVEQLIEDRRDYEPSPRPSAAELLADWRKRAGRDEKPADDIGEQVDAADPAAASPK